MRPGISDREESYNFVTLLFLRFTRLPCQWVPKVKKIWKRMNKDTYLDSTKVPLDFTFTCSVMFRWPN